MDAILITATTISPLLAVSALVLTARKTRHGAALPIDARRLAMAQGSLVAGVLFWIELSKSPGLGSPWGAFVALVLGIVGVVASRNPLRAGTLLWTLAVVFPIGVSAVVVSRYLLADGIVSGAGGVEPISEMIVVALMSSIGFFAGPAFTVGSLLGVGDRRAERRLEKRAAATTVPARLMAA